LGSLAALNAGASTVTTLTSTGLATLANLNTSAITGTTLTTTGLATLQTINAGASTVTTLVASTGGNYGAMTGSTLTTTGLATLASINAGAATVTSITSSGAVNAAGDLVAAGGFKTVIGTWYQYNVAASQTAIAMGAAGTLDATNTTTHQVTEIRSPYAGSVMGVSIVANAARSAGTLTVDATINGTVTGLQAQLDGTNPQYHSATQAKDADPFNAGDRIGVKITTDGTWAPTTADVLVAVVVEF
jgi:hypothetical protein